MPRTKRQKIMTGKKSEVISLSEIFPVASLRYRNHR